MNIFSKTKGYFSVKQMKKEIYGYGYTMSSIKYIIAIIISLISIIGIGFFYQMKWGYIVLVIMTGAMTIPALIRAKFKNMYQKKRFNEVDVYLHQMIYSFQKSPKIITSLEDTSKIATGKLKKALTEAIEYLNTSTSDTIYEDAFRIIEKEYNNTRVKALNKYLINVELQGGEYQTSISIMLEDVDNWITRTYNDQKDIDTVKKTTNVGLIISFILGGVASAFSIMLQTGNFKELNMTASIGDEGMYQAGCVVFMIVCILYFTYTQVSYNRDWVEKTIGGPIVMKDYKNATELNVSRIRLISIPIYVFFLIIAIILFFIKAIPYHTLIAVFVLIIDIYLVIQPSIIKKTSVANTKKNIQDSFSEWLRDVSLNLQEEPLLAAIQDTYDTCPVVLKPELDIFLSKLQQDPSNVEPYYEFLARFHIMDISAAIRNLYSISESDTSSMDSQLAYLIKRNYEIINKNEVVANNDKNAVLRFSESIPIFIASFKLGIDVLCLLGIMI